MKSMLARGLAVLLPLSVTASGADLASGGNWTEVIDAGDLAAGAGSNLISQYESGTGSNTLTVSNTAGVSWRIMARRSDSTWHGDFIVSVRRTSDGSGPGSILGGSSYVQLSTLDAEVCSGTGDRNSVAVQYKLSGMSRNVSPNTYNSAIIFTLVLL